MNTIVRYIITGIAMIALHSCVSVEAYQKAYINDEDMKLDARKVEYYEIGIENYREGSSGANGGKGGGGCGCN
ncbi:MAG: hypothetical protein BWY22_01761 [Bacteroidetes bacterium ADurb.Bin217]|nr:MAG: hypothetical protein BWY22_01761 [Bacteroidetes bacterium ADurb.Bin217]HOS83468.1 DUF4266 domain-containing protein [Bacteroidales bacterium]